MSPISSGDKISARPRKRARVDDDEEDPDNIRRAHVRACSKAPDTSPENPIRDEQYYKDEFSTDEVIIRVQDTLFKASRITLSNTSVAIKDLIHQYDRAVRRSSDSQPLVFATESSYFKALLWALDTGADTLELPPTEDIDVDRLTNLVFICNQYQITYMRAQTLSLLRRVASHKTILNALSSATFQSLVQLAIECNDTRLLATVSSKWVHRVRTEDMPAVPAILAAEKYDLPELAGVAYYEYLQHMVADQVNIRGDTSTWFDSDLKLGIANRTRLVAGFASLVNLWEHIRRHPTALQQDSGCSDDKHRQCVSVWASRWELATRSKTIWATNSSHVRAILRALKSSLLADETLKSDCPCRKGGIAAVQKWADDLERNLHTHFLQPIS